MEHTKQTMKDGAPTFSWVRVTTTAWQDGHFVVPGLLPNDSTGPQEKTAKVNISVSVTQVRINGFTFMQSQLLKYWSHTWNDPMFLCLCCRSLQLHVRERQGVDPPAR